MTNDRGDPFIGKSMIIMTFKGIKACLEKVSMIK